MARKKENMQMPGQISIFEYLEFIQATQELHGNQLCKQQIVFFVDKASIIKYEVYGIYDVDGIETVVLIAKDTMSIGVRNVENQEKCGL